jgi:hypothetical protein
MPLLVLLAVAASPEAFRNATVVSTDVPHLTLTIRGDHGPSEVLDVDPTALARLKLLKAGDEVILTVRKTDGERVLVTVIEPSLRARNAKARPGQRPSRAQPPASPPAPSASASPEVAAPKVSPAPVTGRLPTDTVGPLRDPRKGAQQDPRDNPVRDPRVIPGLTEPVSPGTASPAVSPAPSPTPTPPPTP